MEASTSSWSSPPRDLNLIETHKHIFKIQEFSYLRNCFKNILTLRLLLPSKSVISEDSFLGFLSPELSQIGLRPSLGDDPADPVGCIWKFPKQLYGRKFLEPKVHKVSSFRNTSGRLTCWQKRPSISLQSKSALGECLWLDATSDQILFCPITWKQNVLENLNTQVYYFKITKQAQLKFRKK